MPSAVHLTTRFSARLSAPRTLCKARLSFLSLLQRFNISVIIQLQKRIVKRFFNIFVLPIFILKHWRLEKQLPKAGICAKIL
jgi:hypothetical protein